MTPPRPTTSSRARSGSSAAVVITGVIMSILDTTIVNVALETLARELHAPLSTIQWVSTGYMLALAVVIPLTGWMSERFGAKAVWMTSVALFGVGSALCGLAWSAGSLIFFRILQGFGGGMIMPVGMSVLAQTAGPHRVGRVMSVIGVPMLLGPILGPVIGGLIVDTWSWRWIFYVNVPIAIVSLVLAGRAAARRRGPRRRRQARLARAAAALPRPRRGRVRAVGDRDARRHRPIRSRGRRSSPALMLVAAFVWHAARAPRPLIDVRLFKVTAFGAASATTFLLAASLFGAMIILPLYYQVARGESALAAGLLMAPQGLGAAFVMPIAGKLADKVGGGRVAVVGLVIATLGTLPFAFVTGDTPYALLAVVLVIRGIGIGSTMMPAMAAAYATLDSAAVPRATSALNVLQRVGGAIGTCVMAVVLQHEIRSALGGAAGGGIGASVPEPLRGARRRHARGRVRGDVLVGGRRVPARADPRDHPGPHRAARAARAPGAGRGSSRRPPSAPDLLGDLHDLAQLGPLLLLAERVALDGRGEAALRREAELVDVDELRGLLDAALEQVLALELALLGRDEAEHDELARRHEAQRLEAARARVVPLHEEPVDRELVEQRLGDEVVAALGDPRGAEVAAAHVRGDASCPRGGPRAPRRCGGCRPRAGARRRRPARRSSRAAWGR